MSPEPPTDDTVVAELIEALGEQIVLSSPVDVRFRTDWSGHLPAEPRAVVLARTTAHVSTALAICQAHRQTVVPQGGLTGLAGGATPQSGDVVINLERMVGIEEIDISAATMTVLAGTTLEAAQGAARGAGFELTIDLGARGSAQIGGILATNAGGNRVIRYGMAREHLLGFEVVLADGTVVTSLNKMIKNNAGYDIKHLFVGSEGTLGILTRAVLRLRPQCLSRHTALCVSPSYADVVRLLQLTQRVSTGLSAFEAMWPHFCSFVAEGLGRRLPVDPGDGFAVLIEVTGNHPDIDEALFEDLIGSALETGVISDAFIARSNKEVEELWALREGEPIDRLPSVINFDVSLPIGEIGGFAAACERRLIDRWPAAHVMLFGHIGDSNLHICVSIGAAGVDQLLAVDQLVYATVGEWSGSISAEHGIGVLKRDYLAYSRTAPEIDIMRRIKRALDPDNILNPGKIFGLRTGAP
jgi:FAD/FMN-containing dehydrogenase